MQDRTKTMRFSPTLNTIEAKRTKLVQKLREIKAKRTIALNFTGFSRERKSAISTSNQNGII
jgi:hypothetical protein